MFKNLRNAIRGPFSRPTPAADITIVIDDQQEISAQVEEAKQLVSGAQDILTTLFLNPNPGVSPAVRLEVEGKMDELDEMLDDAIASANAALRRGEMKAV